MMNSKNQIPKDWAVKELNEVVDFLDGKRKPIKDSDRSKMKGQFPYYGASGIIDYVNDYIFDEELILLGEDGANIINRSTPLAFRVSGKIWVNNHAHVLKPKNGYEIGYLTEFLESIKYDKYNTGTAQPKLNKEVCGGIPILLPPLPEQKAIAQVLSTADAAIQTTSTLIAQKELRKKWLMQQLLTGKKQLKGFSGEWKEVRLKDVTTNFSRRNKDLVDAKVYSVTNKSGFVLQSEHFEGKVAGEDLSNYKIIKKNEFAYNPARVNVGSLAYFEEEIGVISSLYVCFKTTKDVLDYFLLQFLQIDHTKHRIEALGEGGVRVYLWYDLFSKIKIKIPSIEEQTAIAQVLQAADKEISLLKAKAEKLREQKKWLMQVLLTGKVRLNIK